MCVFANCYKRMECCMHVHGMAIGAGGDDVLNGMTASLQGACRGRRGR